MLHKISVYLTLLYRLESYLQDEIAILGVADFNGCRHFQFGDILCCTLYTILNDPVVRECIFPILLELNITYKINHGGVTFCEIGIWNAFLYSQKCTLTYCFFCDFYGWVFLIKIVYGSTLK